MAGTVPTSVGGFGDPNPEYPLERVPDRYPKQFKYQANIGMGTDGQYQYTLETSVPMAERRERPITESEIYSPLREGDIAPPGDPIKGPRRQ